MASTGRGPIIAVVGKFMPSCTASSVPLPRPIIRLIHPDRVEDPGSASSTSSMAEKWERLATGRPTAWTAASSPEAHSGASGAIIGCSPNIGSAHSNVFTGTAVVGRAW